MKLNKNIIIYIIIGIVILIGTIFVINSFGNHSYSLTVNIKPFNSNGILVYNGLYPYNTTFFRILINNTGKSKITDMPISVYLNGKMFKSYTVNIPKTEGASIHFNYTFRNSGNSTFKAIADPAGLLNIKNRNFSSNTLIMYINKPINPSQYLAISQYNITDTQDTVMASQGMAIAFLFGNVYNSTLFTDIYGPFVSSMLLNYLSPYTTAAYAAYAEYKNGGKAYTAWIQGTLSPHVIAVLLKTRDISVKSKMINNTELRYGSMKNDTIFCIDSKGGWTRFAFYSEIVNQTCDNFVNGSKAYAAHIITNAINNSNSILKYQNKFVYNNSKSLGSSIRVKNGNVSIINLFYNKHGYFAPVVKKLNYIPENFKPVCYGIIYNETNNTSICESSIVGLKYLKGYALTNATEFFKDYKFTIYSLINSTEIRTSYLNSINLINSLKINQTPISFTSFFKNDCSTENKKVKCGLTSFNHTTNIAYLSIHNLFNKTIRLNNGVCYFVFGNEQILNTTITTNSIENIKLNCGSVGSSVIGAMTNYHIRLNYTYNGIRNTINGTLNVTNMMH